MPTETKLTPWFEWTQTPARNGVYETTLLNDLDEVISTGYSCFKNQEWMDTEHTPDAAARARLTGIQRKRWRGLAEKPANR